MFQANESLMQRETKEKLNKTPVAPPRSKEKVQYTQLSYFIIALFCALSFYCIFVFTHVKGKYVVYTRPVRVSLSFLQRSLNVNHHSVEFLVNCEKSLWSVYREESPVVSWGVMFLMKISLFIQELVSTTKHNQHRTAETKDTQVDKHTLTSAVPPRLFF